MNMSLYTKMLDEIRDVLAGIDPKQTEQAARLICEASRVYVAGCGRSGCMIRAFAIRSMHCGIETYMIGQPLTPSARKNDLLVIGSGSGETESLQCYAHRAKQLNMKILVLTGKPDSSLGQKADFLVYLPTHTKGKSKEGSVCIEDNSDNDGFKSIQPMGSMAEQCMLLCLDAIIVRVIQIRNVSLGDMDKRHANIE
jgi:6-phospho-3-hexuloisomerase